MTIDPLFLLLIGAAALSGTYFFGEWRGSVRQRARADAILENRIRGEQAAALTSGLDFQAHIHARDMLRDARHALHTRDL